MIIKDLQGNLFNNNLDENSLVNNIIQVLDDNKIEVETSRCIFAARKIELTSGVSLKSLGMNNNSTILIVAIKKNPILYEEYDFSQKHKDFVFNYVFTPEFDAKILLTNDACIHDMCNYASDRLSTSKRKCATIGWVFPKNLPPIISSYFRHVCSTILTRPLIQQAGVYTVDAYWWGAHSNNIDFGIIIHFNCKHFHSIFTLPFKEFYMLYACVKKGIPYPPIMNLRERRDGKYALKALLNGTYFKGSGSGSIGVNFDI